MNLPLNQAAMLRSSAIANQPIWKLEVSSKTQGKFLYICNTNNNEWSQKLKTSTKLSFYDKLIQNSNIKTSYT